MAPRHGKVSVTLGLKIRCACTELCLCCVSVCVYVCVCKYFMIDNREGEARTFVFFSAGEKLALLVERSSLSFPLCPFPLVAASI